MKNIGEFLKFGNSIAESYKSISAKYTIICMLLIGAYFVYSELTTPLLVSRENIVGTVIDIRHGTDKNATNAIPYFELELTDKKTIKLNFFGRPHLMVGDQVPLITELYENGQKLHVVDYSGWTQLH